jgi:hypothetical protein
MEKWNMIFWFIWLMVISNDRLFAADFFTNISCDLCLYRVLLILCSWNPTLFNHLNNRTCFVKCTSYEIRHYIFCSLLIVSYFWVQTFSSVPLSQTPSLHVISIMRDYDLYP